MNQRSPRTAHVFSPQEQPTFTIHIYNCLQIAQPDGLIVLHNVLIVLHNIM